MERLTNAASYYEALQDSATDPRVGVVQPITVAEGNELMAALDQACKALRAADPVLAALLGKETAP